MNKRFLAFLSMLLPLALDAHSDLENSHHYEKWKLKWVHTQPVDHPTRKIVFTEIKDKQNNYHVRFNNGVEGSFILSHRTETEFIGSLNLNKSTELPDGDRCTLNGVFCKNHLKGTWHCQSQDQGNFTGKISPRSK